MRGTREALPLREGRRRWAELLRRIYEVDPLMCPACGGAMRILAFITEGAVIDQVLAHLRRTRGDARGPPSTQRPAPRRARARIAGRSRDVLFRFLDLFGYCGDKVKVSPIATITPPMPAGKNGVKLADACSGVLKTRRKP